ncbi:uncharacterized protein K489DRAFT_397882 [Dissoconium aciculare CBS 342.82]|uniref:Uncharacterized protein n=1 Tax=Dissoconium aciculare CBS 342.82 TaxID=1314786 RepID=A0A6J3MIV9_9PEZI|nr:uncharacterized protein K489DRAFT_397882 [Dissoconium aciculare CBS 342.82]KAF1827644.1 hypothetical protein K489DRAFT_397882 [Dissoconium aciculare CBS 342.82]
MCRRDNCGDEDPVGAPRVACTRTRRRANAQLNLCRHYADQLETEPPVPRGKLCTASSSATISARRDQRMRESYLMCSRANDSAAPQAGPGCFDEDRGIAGRSLVNRRGSAADCVGGLQRDCRDPRVIVIYPAPCIASLGLKEIGWTPVGCQHVPLDRTSVGGSRAK